MTLTQERLIVALDTNAAASRVLARELAGVVRWVKVGMTLFYEAGPGIVTELRQAGFEVFLDLKLHDIPHQVRGAAETLGRLGARMLTTHASGGEAMLRAAVEGARAGAEAAGVAPPAVLAVTVLTSLDDAALASIGVPRPAAEQVPLLAALVQVSGASGIVCSPNEARAMRTLLGEEALIVVPGVRPAWAEAGDQSRIATPEAAIAAGASHLVIGRPITEARDPAEAARAVLNEMEALA